MINQEIKKILNSEDFQEILKSNNWEIQRKLRKFLWDLRMTRGKDAYTSEIINRIMKQRGW